MAGDWNFAGALHDRLCISSNSWTGDRDKQEAEHFHNTLSDRVVVPEKRMEFSNDGIGLVSNRNSEIPHAKMAPLPCYL